MEHVNLVKAEHMNRDFSEKNPQQLVPLLEDGETKIHQSLAILEYLEEKFPDPTLLPEQLKDKMAVKAFALEVACEIHPLNNLRILEKVEYICQKYSLITEKPLSTKD